MSKDKLYVIKVGGNVIEDEQKLSVLLDAFHGMTEKKILVHGGGKLASKYAQQLGVEVKMHEGRRITNQATIDIVTMVYGGLVNKKMVAALQGMNCPAIGMTGADADLIRSTKRAPVNGIDFGFVGDPEEVNVAFLQSLLQQDLVPVIAPLTHNGAGELLNTNADTMAGVIAKAMKEVYEVSLVFAFELPGVLEDVEQPETVIRVIDQNNFSQLKAEGKIHSGMIPKLTNALEAVQAGVAQVCICHFGALENITQANFSNYTKIIL